MTTQPRRVVELRKLLEAVEDAPPVAAAEVLAEVLGAVLDARDVSFLIADYSGRSLVRLRQPPPDETRDALARERTDIVQLPGTPYGRAMEDQELQVVEAGSGHQLLAPVTNRGEALGVLELTIDQAPDEQTLESVAGAAHALAYVVIANRRFTDLFEWGQRSRPLSLEAEIQQRLLPGSYTCEAGQFTLAGWLEPAGDVAGDTFDFSLERDTLHLSMTDAMGHALNASLLATVLVGALRHARRRGATLVEQAGTANAALFDYAGIGRFVTGQLVRVDMASGIARIVNAGHPPPVLIRGGVVETIDLRVDPPFGARAESDFRVQEVALRARDRLVFLTDGMLERNASAVDVASVLTASCHLHPREAVQRLTREVVKACGGELRDDAAVLCLDWHGVDAERNATAGAND